MTWVDDVWEFQDACDVPQPERPATLSMDRLHMRLNLIAEEFLELLHACGANTFAVDAASDAIFEAIDSARGDGQDLVEMADAIGDLSYVGIGLGLEAGIPIDDVWIAIQDSNMRKIGPDGKVYRRADGKVAKPPGWIGPHVAEIIAEASK
jgi:predicted HAD superfamily Cof-like phosphohydrolase